MKADIVPENPNRASPVNNSISPLSMQSAKDYVTNYEGHAVEMLNQLHQQNLLSFEGVANIYMTARNRIGEKINTTITPLLTGEQPTQKLTQEDIKILKKRLKNVEKEVVKIIRETQIELASEIGVQQFKQLKNNSDPKIVASVKNKVATLAKGGWGAKWISFLALTSDVDKYAVTSFEKTKKTMDQAAHTRQIISHETDAELDKQIEFITNPQKTLDRGVVGLQGIYRFQAAFSEKKIRKQFKLFCAQRRDEFERLTLSNEIRIVIPQGTQQSGGIAGQTKTFSSNQVPLNEEFDKSLQIENKPTIFTKISGKRGISSGNRTGPHLVNAWYSTLSEGTKVIYKTFRTAVMSDKFEKDPKIRQDNSRNQAYELGQAMTLKTLEKQGLTIDKAIQSEQALTININSISLVTPDRPRSLLGFFLPFIANEKQMLQEQTEALKNLEKLEEIVLDGKKIKVKFTVNTFNFGVNELAVKYGQGLDTQHKQNLQSMHGLVKQYQQFRKRSQAEIVKITKALGSAKLTPQEERQLKNRREDLITQNSNAQLIINEIKLLMKDKKSYFQGNNPYNIQAKIINLTNIIDETDHNISKANNEDNIREASPSSECVINCMSGKDRTGWLDALAKTRASMAQFNNGEYYSDADIMKNAELRTIFVDLFKKHLKESGGLEITKLNTGMYGYKVGKEAGLLGMVLADILEAQGLSSLTFK